MDFIHPITKHEIELSHDEKAYAMFVDQVQAAGEDIGDMFEISTVRREDWDFIQVIKRMVLTAILMAKKGGLSISLVLDKYP